MASVKAVRFGAASMNRFSMPPHPAPGIAGEPRDMGVSWLDPRPEPGALETPISMGKPGHRPLSNRSSHLVTGEAMPLVRPPTLESPDPPKVGSQMGGMVMASSLYTGGVRGPGVGEVFPDAKGSNTLSKPHSLLSLASCPAASVSLGVAYGQGTSRPVVLQRGWRSQCGYSISLVEVITIPVTLACSCLFLHASCQSGGSRVLSASVLALLSFS